MDAKPKIVRKVHQDALLLMRARRLALRSRADVACLPCKSRKAKCSDFCPCSRCVNYERADTCIDGSSASRSNTRPIQDSANTTSLQTTSFAAIGTSLAQAAETDATMSSFSLAIGISGICGPECQVNGHAESDTYGDVLINRSPSIQQVSAEQWPSAALVSRWRSRSRAMA